MPEHVHRWHFRPNYKPDLRGYGTYAFTCTVVGCDEAILLPEAERRINAAEKLSLEKAIHVLHYYEGGYPEALIGYIAARQGAGEIQPEDK